MSLSRRLQGHSGHTLTVLQDTVTHGPVRIIPAFRYIEPVQTTLNCYFLFIAEASLGHFASLPSLSRLFGQGIAPSGGVFSYSI